MSDFSLVPVDHQPAFDNVSFVPVDHDPFADDGGIRQAQAQQAQTQTQPMQPEPQGQLQQSATGVSQPNVGGPANNTQATASTLPPNDVPFRSFGELKPAAFTPSQQIGYQFGGTGASQLNVNASSIDTQATAPGSSSSSNNFAQAGQPAQNGQPTPEGGLTIKNLDNGSSDLRTVPGVTVSPSEPDGEAVFADPSHKEFKSTEKVPQFNGEMNRTVGISGNVADLGNGSFQVTNGKITIKTVSESGEISFVTHDIRGNAYAIVRQPPNGGPISVEVGSAGN
jgi:hypothetical protein